jgi:hypothetical protein
MADGYEVTVGTNPLVPDSDLTSSGGGGCAGGGTGLLAGLGALVLAAFVARTRRRRVR